MSAERWSIKWEGRLVGWIESPRIDFPHYYGRWNDVEGPDAATFLAALRLAVNKDDGLIVEILDGIFGIAYVHPDDDNGEFNVRQVGFRSARNYIQS